MLLLAAWASYAFRQHALMTATLQQETAYKAAAEAERQRLATVKAEQERQASAAAAEAQRKAAEAEQQRPAAVKAEQDRQASAAAAEAKRKAADAEQQRLAAIKAEQDRQARGAAKEFEAAGFVLLSPDQQKLLLAAVATTGLRVDRISEAEEIRTFPASWPQIGRAGDLIFVADQVWSSRYAKSGSDAPRFSQALAAFVKESRPQIRAFTLSAKGFELLQSIPAFTLPTNSIRFLTTDWSAHIKTADLPLGTTKD
jgi:hypothetical protein